MLLAPADMQMMIEEAAGPGGTAGRVTFPTFLRIAQTTPWY